jgi:signal transduction histidine kinase
MRNKEKKQEYREFMYQKKLEFMQTFSASMAHEIKTPLTGLSVSADILNDIFNKTFPPVKPEINLIEAKIEADDYDLMHTVNHIIQTLSHRSATIVDSILISMKNSSIVAEKKYYNLKECVEQAVRNYKICYPGIKHNIEASISSDTLVLCSSKYIQQMIDNLLRNAYEHANNSNLVIKIWNQKNTLYFEDNGKGIAAEDLEHIFDKFFTKSIFGTGAGLSFCRTVMEDIGGSITCQSETGEYTRFIMIFSNWRDFTNPIAESSTQKALCKD